MTAPVIRFTFSIVHGPNAGLNCGQFRVWCGKNDTYIADRETASTWKASLHGDESWRVAETKESHLSSDPKLHGDRAPWEFTVPPMENGRRLAFVVAVTRGALTLGSAPARYQVIPVEDRWDRIPEVNIWMSEEGVEIPTSNRVGPVLSLANGRSVWAEWGVEPVPAVEPEPLPASAILKPLVPEKDGVSAPGWIVVGAHLG